MFRDTSNHFSIHIHFLYICVRLDATFFVSRKCVIFLVGNEGKSKSKTNRSEQKMSMLKKNEVNKNIYRSEKKPNIFKMSIISETT